MGDSWYSFIIDRRRLVSAGIYAFPLYRMIPSSFVQSDSADHKGGAECNIYTDKRYGWFESHPTLRVTLNLIIFKSYVVMRGHYDPPPIPIGIL